MKKTSCLFGLGVAVTVVLVAGSAPAQEKPDLSKVIGNWKVEVYAGSSTYYLNLVVTDVSGQLAGKVSESMGSFTGVSIIEIVYDSEAFRFDFVAPTPPDGMLRTVKVDFEIAEDAMGGTLAVPDLDVIADAKAIRQS